MFWILLLINSNLFAGENLQAIRNFQKKLPRYDNSIQDDQFTRWKTRKYLPPVREVTLDKIVQSGTFQGHIPANSNIVNVNDNTTKKNNIPFQGLFYNLPDEYGFKYLISKDGSTTFKIHESQIENLTGISQMYERPLTYTPAPANVTKINYDSNLSLKPEFSFYAGLVEGNFFRDFFNDSKAYLGQTTQYGFHYFTKWKYPVKVGAVLHYELSSYSLTGGGNAKYSSFSIGPQFKSKEFELMEKVVRFQMQYRFSTLANISGETIYGSVSEKLNSSDLLVSLEHPIKNKWGEFVLGFFIQRQWLNIRQQSQIVSLRSSTNFNQAYGLSISQVLE